MTTKYKTPVILPTGTKKLDIDSSFWFSENVEDWYKSKVKKNRKKDKEKKQIKRTKGRAQFL